MSRTPNRLKIRRAARPAGLPVTRIGPRISGRPAARDETTCYRCGVNEVEQWPARLPLTTETDTVTL
jgi:hypothetical protein